MMPAMERYYAAACQIDLPNPLDRSGIAERTSKMQNPTELIEAADKSLLQDNHPS